jgi:dTDP-4-dehydrorhamnose reductase
MVVTALNGSSDGINPLVKEAFNINKNISNENIYTWYTFATEIFKEVELNHLHLNII